MIGLRGSGNPYSFYPQARGYGAGEVSLGGQYRAMVGSWRASNDQCWQNLAVHRTETYVGSGLISDNQGSDAEFRFGSILLIKSDLGAFFVSAFSNSRLFGSTSVGCRGGFDSLAIFSGFWALHQAVCMAGGGMALDGARRLP